MSSTDNNRPPGKSGQRNRKPKQASKKPDQRQSLKPGDQPDRLQDYKELIEAADAPTESFPIQVDASTETLPIEADSSIGAASTSPAVWSTEPASKGALVAIDAFPIGAAISIDTFLTGFQAIANAYRDYTRRSLEQTVSFVEKLTTVRSLEKTVEIQTEFAKQACETFLTDQHKIWRLYSELTKQIFRPIERLVTRVAQTAR
jgi:hypothetical protein